MNKDLNINRCWVVVFPLSSNDFLKYKHHNRIGYSDTVFLLPIGSSQPKTTDSDYIENKTTLGGLTLIKSMTQNSFIKSFIKFMLCLLSNIRPHMIFNKATYLNRTLILERKA